MTTAHRAMMRDSFEPIRVLDIELTRPLSDRTGLEGYRLARVLVRVHDEPVGIVDVGIHEGTCRASDIRDAVTASGLDTTRDPAPPFDGPWPTLTVAVCTRGRPDELAGCLEYLAEIDYPDPEIIIIDNAPTDGVNAAVCAAFPRVRHIVEPRPGLNWARNRAVLEALGDIIAFTDDDVRVDRNWARELILPFIRDADVMAVAGLGVPFELETRAQLLFEEYGGASGGVARIRLQGAPHWGVRGMWHYGLVAPHGSGANMAFRRAIFDEIGRFDTALDVGTPANGGGDTEMFFRVLAHGHAMVYEPRAVIRHRHRIEYNALVHQISGWGSGMYAFLTRSVLAFPKAWWVLGLLGARGIGLLLLKLMKPNGMPRRLVLSHLAGAFAGPFRFAQARSRARAIERRFGPQTRSES